MEKSDLWDWENPEFKNECMKNASMICKDLDEKLKACTDSEPWLEDEFCKFFETELFEQLKDPVLPVCEYKLGARKFLNELSKKLEELDDIVYELSGNADVVKSRMLALDFAIGIDFASRVIFWNPDDLEDEVMDVIEKSARIAAGPYYEYKSMLKIAKNV